MRWLLLLAAPAFAISWSAPAQAQLPASLDREIITTCAPKTIESATRCLRDALSAQDAADLTNHETGRRYRGEIDEFLRVAWNLRDRETSLVREMISLGVYHPIGAPGLIIDNLGYSLRGQRLDFARVSEAMKRAPMPDDTGPWEPSDRGIPEGSVQLPASECKTAPGLVTLRCYRTPDGREIAIAAGPVDLPTKETSDAD